MIYQEQVQQSAQILAGYSLGGADILRRAMGKKIKSEMDSQREQFVLGAEKKSISKKISNTIFDQISAFAGYGFNKSHAAAYAMITYQTAWLRAHYPYEFFAASMSQEINDTDKLSEFVVEAKLLNITLLAPDIKEDIIGSAEILEIFKVSNAGKVAGSRVNDGAITSTANARLIRDGAIIYTGKISTIFREKNQVKQVEAGQECGITLKDYNDYQKKDIIEAFSSTSTERMI